MLDAESAKEVAEIVQPLARDFVKHYLRDDCDLTEQYLGKSKTGGSPILGALANFVMDVAESPIGLMPFEPDGFASWIYSDDQRLNIVLDPRQMINWYQRNGLLIHTQRVRCIIHELGHVFTSRIESTESGNTKFGVKNRKSSEFEEEKAWVFTFMFLSLVLGDYSYRRRTKRDPEDDNTVVAHV